MLGASSSGVLGGLLGQPAEARTPLQGSASFSRPTALPSDPFSAKVYYPGQNLILRGDRLAEQYKLQAAESLYRSALRQNPSSAGAWNGLGKIAYYQTTSSNQILRSQTGALQDKAIQQFLTALRYQPGYVEARTNLARLYMEKGRMDEAGSELNKAFQLAPSDYRVLARMGEWLVRRQEYDEAIPLLQRAIQKHSADDTAYYYLAVAYTERNQLDEALTQLNSAAWLNPDNAPVRYQMGVIYEKQGNGSAAVEAYQKALALKPELTTARDKLARYLEAKGDMGQALSHWKRLRESSEPNWDMTEHIARLSIQNQQPEVAVSLYRDWMVHHPEDKARANTGLSQAKTELARLKLRDEDLVSQGEAKRYAEQAVQYQPNNFEARLMDARLDREMGQIPSPIAGKEPGMVDVALRQSTDQPYQSYEKGRMLLARFQFDEAEDAFREARRTGEGNRSQMVFGELFLNLGLPDLAQESFELVEKRLPGNASARLGKAKAEQARAESLALLAEARKLENKQTRSVVVEKLKMALLRNVRNAEAHYRLAQQYEKQENYGLAADHYYAYLHVEPVGDKANTAKSRIGSLKEKMARQQASNR